MELEFVRWLRERIPPHPNLLLGPGDDAAILRLARDAQCVLSVDMLMDGVDFHLADVGPTRVGRKALAVNLSDLAAMAATPSGAVVALALPRSGGFEMAKGLYEGMLPLAEKYSVALAGGDTNSWDGPLVISVTVVGEVTSRGPLRRGGAKPGDNIVVSGRFGGSILGHHLEFEPRVREALDLHARYSLHAGIDVSDGLSLDLWRLTEESRCGAVIDTSRIPIAPDAERWARRCNDGSTAVDHALSDGEDFELILAVPAAETERLVAESTEQFPLACIGQIVAERGLWRRGAAGARVPLEPRGFVHGLKP